MAEQKIEWSPEEWIKTQADMTTSASRLSNYYQLVTAVQATIAHAEKVALSSPQLSGSITKQCQLLTNAAAKMVLAGLAHSTTPSPEKQAEFEQADAIVVYNHKLLIDLISSKSNDLDSVQSPQSTAAAQETQTLVTELSANVKKLLAWKDKVADISTFPQQFDTGIYLLATDVAFYLTPSLAVTDCINSFASIITNVLKDGATQLKLLEELQPLANQGSDLVDKATAKVDLPPSALKAFFDALFIMLKNTTTAVREKK